MRKSGVSRGVSRFLNAKNEKNMGKGENDLDERKRPTKAPGQLRMPWRGGNHAPLSAQALERHFSQNWHYSGASVRCALWSTSGQSIDTQNNKKPHKQKFAKIGKLLLTFSVVCARIISVKGIQKHWKQS